MYVVSKIIEKCKTAIKAGIPVIYIKTDSYELMKEVVESEELVRLLSKIPNGGYRPFQEELKKGNVISGPVNWEEDRLKFSEWKCPHIVTIAIQEESFRENELLCYVKNYMNAFYTPEQQKLQEILKSSAVILYSSQIRISKKLLRYCEVIEVDYPEYEEIYEIVKKKIVQTGETILEKNMQQLCSLLQGLDIQEIYFILNKILTRDMAENVKSLLEEAIWNENRGKKEINLSADVRKIIQKQKEQRLQDGNQVLKLISVDEKEIGGMKELTEYIDKIVEQRLFEDVDRNRKIFGANTPKGVLLCGIPGCGKSLAAKLTAQRLKLTLLQMDVGNLMGGIQGESEENMRKALRQVEAMSPCVLWIDELEKGFSGLNSNGGSDGGTFKRMFATLLNWMQENKKPCFIFATANDIGGLPKELFRSGRFNELFGVYLPTKEECADIFVKQVQDAIRSTEEYRKKAGMKQLLSDEALKKEFYMEIMDECLAKEEKCVRIVIGSDIEKIVNDTLVEFCQDIRDDISMNEWKASLEEVIQNTTVYGDSQENIESIAVGYCRMLRKGLRPTVKDALFRKEDYHYERAFRKQKKEEGNGGSSENNEENPCILDRRNGDRTGYDDAVYNLLYEKINEVAYLIEQYERKKLVER